MRVLTLVGNRPQFVKAAAVSRVLREGHEEVLVHSGQHYDDELSAVFFRELGVPAPDHELRVGSAPDGEQIGRIMHAFEPVAAEVAPDVGLVYGDTNTTLAGALSCARTRIPLAHVEAGMRAFDRSMPEERNRVLTDHLSDLLLCPTETAVANLEREGITEGAELVGDVMADVALAMAPVASRKSEALTRLGVMSGSYLLVTAHRAGNVDDPGALGRLVEVLLALPLPAVFPVHPRTRERMADAGVLERLERHPSLTLTQPLGYLDFLALLQDAAAVVTDSGGVQKEAYLAGTPCVTLRDTTEWTETVELGWNRLVGLDAQQALAALNGFVAPTSRPELYGGGHAARRVVEALERWASRVRL
ncbi:MAG: non-hydrolyzing UDP-N-acetylglucosamine 2-epimerase [Solirubrobacterales bacterium]